MPGMPWDKREDYAKLHAFIDQGSEWKSRSRKWVEEHMTGQRRNIKGWWRGKVGYCSYPSIWKRFSGHTGFGRTNNITWLGATDTWPYRSRTAYMLNADFKTTGPKYFRGSGEYPMHHSVRPSMHLRQEAMHLVILSLLRVRK